LLAAVSVSSCESFAAAAADAMAGVVVVDAAARPGIAVAHSVDVVAELVWYVYPAESPESSR